MIRNVLLVLAAACCSFPNAALAADAPKLAPGKYTCISGMTKQPVSLGAILSADSTYTDLEGTNGGTYAVDGTGVSFVDGIMDGYVAEITADNSFKIGFAAVCTLEQDQ